MTPVPTRHPLASSLLTPVGMAPVVDIVFAPIVASHPQRTGEVSSAKRLSVSAVEDLHGQKSQKFRLRNSEQADKQFVRHSSLQVFEVWPLPSQGEAPRGSHQQEQPGSR